MPTDDTFEHFGRLINTGGFIRILGCEYDGKYYEFTVTAKQQAVCPQWDSMKDANPPLSAAKALAKATEFIATIKTKEGFSWQFEEIALVRNDWGDIDGWMWQARYRLTRRGPMSGVWPQMNCWILMDGTIIQPRIIEAKK